MRFRHTLAVLALAFAVVGCSVVPIHNVDQAVAPSASGKPLTQEQVRGAIMRAGSTLGWQVKDDGPGMLAASITLRKHSAVLALPYSASNYSIKYRSSENLEEKDGSIHKNYNSWVQNLHRNIAVELAKL